MQFLQGLVRLCRLGPAARAADGKPRLVLLGDEVGIDLAEYVSALVGAQVPAPQPLVPPLVLVADAPLPRDLRAPLYERLAGIRHFQPGAKGVVLALVSLPVVLARFPLVDEDAALGFDCAGEPYPFANVLNLACVVGLL